MRLLVREEGKRYHDFVKYFSTFMYDHTLHCGRKFFFRYCLQAFRTEKTLKLHIKDCFQINSKQIIKMHKKG